jgi:hypothetical protein
MDKEIVFPLSGHDHSQCLLIAQVMWWENDTQKFRQNPSARFDCTNAQSEYHGQWRFSREAKFIWGPTESTKGETFATLVIQRETKMLVCVSWAASRSGIRASQCEH